MKHDLRTVDIPEDIVTTVLSLLPVKTLARFRCVCKQWDALLQSPMFMSLHKSVHAEDELVYLIAKPPSLVFPWHVFFDGADSLESSSLLKFPQNQYIEFKGSCNGLVLFCLNQGTPTKFGPRLVNKDRSVFIWNPCSGKLKAIDISMTNPEFELYHWFAFGFGSCEQLDGGVNDYKVVVFPNEIHRATKPVVNVYTLSTRSWKRVAVDPTSSNFVLRHDQLCVPINGTLYWFGRRKSAGEPGVIITFDLQKEVLGEIALPNGSDAFDTHIKWILGNYRQCLSLVLHKPASRTLSTWVFRKGHGVDFAAGCWEEVFVISIEPSVARRCFGSRVLLTCGVRDVHVVFDTETQQWIQLGDNARHLKNLYLNAIAYNESLVSLDEKWWR